MANPIPYVNFAPVTDKHTYDTAQEVSEAFGTSIKQSLTELQPGECLEPFVMNTNVNICMCKAQQC